jgi:alpha-L-fucosidase
VAGGNAVGDAGALLDADPDTFWTTNDGPSSVTITAEFPAPVRANCIMLQEHIASGQRIEAFEVDVFAEDGWRPAARGTVVGYKRLLRFAETTTSKIRIRLTQFRVRPTLSGIGLFLAPTVQPVPKMTTDGSRLAKAKWKVLDCDSLDPVEGAASNAIDDDLSTFWHSRYRDGVDSMPHHLSVDLGETVTIAGFTYTPRQDQWDGGIILRARFEISDDGKRWTVAADNVDFDNIVNSRQEQVVKLAVPLNARYFRLTALRTANDNNLTSAADVSVLVK